VVVVQADTLISVTRLLERLGLPMPIVAGQPSDVVWVWCMKVVELSNYHWGGEKPRNLMFPKGSRFNPELLHERELEHEHHCSSQPSISDSTSTRDAGHALPCSAMPCHALPRHACPAFHYPNRGVTALLPHLLYGSSMPHCSRKQEILGAAMCCHAGLLPNIARVPPAS
jgi:hypothetical protein